MTPGEITMLKIIEGHQDIQEARHLIEKAFPTKLAQYVFDQVLKSLLARRLIARTKRGKCLTLTVTGKDLLAAELRAESRFLEQEHGQ